MLDLIVGVGLLVFLWWIVPKVLGADKDRTIHMEEIGTVNLDLHRNGCFVVPVIFVLYLALMIVYYMLKS